MKSPDRRTGLFVTLASIPLGCGLLFLLERGAPVTQAVAVRDGSQPVNLLVITVDTFRVDHVGCYGYGKVKTPNIDRLARSGVRFDNAISQVPLTFPSHCVMFTSTYPQFNFARDNGASRLESSAVTLAEQMQGKGLATAAFVSSFVLDPRFGLNQGFGLYDFVKDTRENKNKVVKSQDAERPADKVTPLVVQWLRKNKGRPFFVWAHYYDAHHPYEPPSPYKEQYKDQPYDGEIAFVDAQIGIVLSALKELGLDQTTLVVLASDHGEGLGEHGESTHAVFLYDATQRVPLLFSHPGSIAAGKAVKAQVRLADITPTILALFGMKSGSQMQGESLVPLLGGADGVPRDLPAYSESLYAKLHYNWSELHAWRQGEWKYIDSSEPELYNLRTDPGETANLFKDKREIASRLEGELQEFLKRTSSGKAGGSRVEMDEETKQKLISLGYLPGSGAGADAKGPVPLKMIQVMEKLNLAVQLLNGGKSEKAVEVLDAIVREDPGNVQAYVRLGQAYKELKKYDEAARSFKKAASFRAADADAHDGLGNVYKSMGRVDAAFQEFELAHKLDPQNAGILVNMGWCYQQKGKVDLALEYYGKALALDDSLATAHANRAICYRMKGQMPEAMAELQRALQLDPDLAFAHAELCACRAIQGDLGGAIQSCKKAISLDPRSFDGHTNLGVCYARRGDPAKALASFLEAREAAPWNASAHSNLGNAYVALGKPDEAEKAFRKALEIDPSNKAAAQMLKKLGAPGGK